ncbi:hypothetical protein [Streptomyces sp. WZ.A104]|uniref:hypothetical protein n=1 Tax=Streptomyces sp. WZ.A104 TaxID=2023771 RepID=UPI00117E51B6|nr:hypothetical protein [Streptomyces sp. WZ.A104]
MEIATVRRTLNGTLTELQRAVDAHSVAKAADLYEVAWHQASQAPPSETREQRARLKVFKEVLASRSWREEERRQAAQGGSARAVTHPSRHVVPAVRPAAEPLPDRREEVWSSDAATSGPTVRPSKAAPCVPGTQAVGRAESPELLPAGRLWEIATDVRPVLEQTARARSTISWPAMRKRLPVFPRLHRDDESVVLWLVDEDRQKGEPLLSVLVTVGDRQMHPRFPQIAEQLGLSVGRTPDEQRSAWSYEVLKVYQHWRHRH